MAKNKSPLEISLEYHIVRLFFGLLKGLTPSVALPICHRILRTLLLFVPKRRRLMEANIAACFPDKSLAERRSIAADSIQNLARGIAMYPHIPDLGKTLMPEFVTVEGIELLNDAVKKGRGTICFTAHYGFWEMMAIYITRFYPKIAMIVRSLDNPRIDALVSGVRRSGGGSVIPHRRALKDSLSLLRENGVLGILIDQNFYKGGVFVDFFGRLAATTSIVSLFARRTDCVVLPMHNRWVGNTVRIIVEPAIVLSTNPDPEQAVMEDTQLMTRYVERWIREDPSQWLWIHNRWKRKPEAGDLVLKSSNAVGG